MSRFGIDRWYPTIKDALNVLRDSGYQPFPTVGPVGYWKKGKSKAYLTVREDFGCKVDLRTMK